MGGGGPSNTFIDVAIYMCNVVAVHACTCSCLMSAFLYQKANGLGPEVVSRWASDCKIMLKVPVVKFSFGCFPRMVNTTIMVYVRQKYAKNTSCIVGIFG